MDSNFANIYGFKEWSLVGFISAFSLLLTCAVAASAVFYQRVREAWQRIPAGVPSRYGWEETPKPQSSISWIFLMVVLMLDIFRLAFGGTFPHCLLLLRTILVIGGLMYLPIYGLYYAVRLVRVFRDANGGGETRPMLHYARLMIAPTLAGLTCSLGLCWITVTLLLEGKLR